MKIFEDKSIKNTIEELASIARKSNTSTAKLESLCMPKIVFVCGKSFDKGNQQNNGYRQIIIDKFQEYKIQVSSAKKSMAVKCVLSELIEDDRISKDLLTFEEMLAEISEKIIIVAESSGTFCELGAFVSNDNTFRKTIVFNNNIFESEKSFVNRGPLKKISDENKSNVVWYPKYDEKYGEFSGLSKTIKRIVSDKVIFEPNLDKDNIKLAGLICELACIIEWLQPLLPDEIEPIYKKIKKIDSYSIRGKNHKEIFGAKNIGNVLFLMEKIGIVYKNEEGLYCLVNELSYYNTLFSANRMQYNKKRAEYISYIYKREPSRMKSYGTKR